MEYEILNAKNREDLIKVVNQFIKLGWHVQGGVSYCVSGTVGYMCSQAMVKYDEKEIVNS